MNNNARLLFKALSPRIMVRALMTLDKATAVVVGVSWAVALVILVTAAISVSGALAAKRMAADAHAIEPVLPVATTSRINQHDAAVLVDRLQRQFPDIKIDVDGNQTLLVKTSDASRFHQWITALSYIDTMSPQMRWTIRDFCVGNCGQGDLMRASVVGQSVKFALPPPS